MVRIWKDTFWSRKYPSPWVRQRAHPRRRVPGAVTIVLPIKQTKEHDVWQHPCRVNAISNDRVRTLNERVEEWRLKANIFVFGCLIFVFSIVRRYPWRVGVRFFVNGKR